MSTDTSKTSKWVFTLIGSVALNGLLAGMLISNNMTPKVKTLHFEAPHHDSSSQKQPLRRALSGASYDNPNRLVARLEPHRRREVMSTAMKQLRKQSPRKPHQLFMELRKSHKQILELLQSDILDETALQAVLTTNRGLKDELAVQGDALVLEILKQLTPEERQGVAHTLHRMKRKRKRKRKKRTPPE